MGHPRTFYGVKQSLLIKCGVVASDGRPARDERFVHEFDIPKGWKVLIARSRVRNTGYNQIDQLEGDHRRIVTRVPRDRPFTKAGKPIDKIPVLVTFGALCELLDAWYEVHGRSWTTTEGEDD